MSAIFAKFLKDVKKGKIEVPVYDTEGNFLRNATPEEVENVPETLVATFDAEIIKSLATKPVEVNPEEKPNEENPDAPKDKPEEEKTPENPPADPNPETPPDPPPTEEEVIPENHGVATRKENGEVDYSKLPTDNLAKDYCKPKSLNKGNSIVRRNDADGVGTLYIKEATGTETELSFYSTIVGKEMRKLYKEKGKIF